MMRRLSLVAAGTIILLMTPVAARGADTKVRFSFDHDLGFADSVDVWTVHATRLWLEYTADQSVTFTVDQARKAFPSAYATSRRLDGASRGAPDPVPTYHVSPTATPKVIVVQWGFPVTNTSLAMLHIEAVWLRGNGPSLAQPSTRPLLVAMGDSITVGAKTTGPLGTSKGYADRFSRTWHVWNFAVGTTSATCYGQYHVGDVVAARPSAVIVAYGTNDIVGDCHGTIDDFRAAMDSILRQLQDGLPSAAVYVGSILPRTGEGGKSVSEWNAVLRQVAADHGVPFVDTGAGFDPATQTSDGLHPTVAGHRQIAAIWNRSW
jgi:lysophospholipase L1-like esterase